MAEYEADVMLNGKNPPLVRETDHAKQRSGESEEALRRIYVRASEPGGLISVYESRVLQPVPLAAPARPSASTGRLRLCPKFRNRRKTRIDAKSSKSQVS